MDRQMYQHIGSGEGNYMCGKNAAEGVNPQSVSPLWHDVFPCWHLTDFLEGCDGGVEAAYAETRLSDWPRAAQKLRRRSAVPPGLLTCSFYSVCVCLHWLLAHMVTHYGRYVTASIFTPLSLIVAIHLSPSCQPASTQLLLPWRHLTSWHMNQSPPFLPH